MLPLHTRFLIILVLLALHSPATTTAQSAEIVGLRDVPPQSMATGGFVLPAAADVQIHAVGAEFPRRESWKWWNEKHYWAGNAWILNAQTREVVWELRKASSSVGGDDLRAFDGTIRLPAGTYEAYYASYPASNWNVSAYSDRSKIHPKGEFVQISDRDGRRYVTVYGGPLLDSGAYKKFELVVRGPGRAAGSEDLNAARERARSGALVAFLNVAQSGFEHQGFELRRPTKLDIYAVGEAREETGFDAGWIVNAETREREWSLTFDRSSHGGGAEKNRMVRTSVTLPAGRYAAVYAMDDSHHPGDWNSVPPHDPVFWGMVIKPADPSQASAIERFTYEMLPTSKPLVDLTRVRDDETRSQGFVLTQRMDVRIYAVGEGRGGEMFDSAWILDARSRRVVWEMEHRSTEHAGGDAKNRLFDRPVRLDAGSYVAYFATDDSHAYGDWNASPPIMKEFWGLTILRASEPVPNGVFRLVEEEPDASVLAELIHVRDDAHERERFTLSNEADVRIYAIGEGDDGHMHDYGWIEDRATGRTVWEMTYRMTDHAGGARKNRVLDMTTRLPAGEYEVHFKSDGSHSFNDWNAERPDDPQRWGITVRGE